MNLEGALELAGVDYKTTLNRFSNNAILLEKFIKKLPQDTTFQELKTAVDGKRYEDVERLAHTLKGVSGNLGFEHLSYLSAEMVHFIRSNRYETDDIRPVFSKMIQEYDKVVSCINQID